ncbi:MAG: DUF4351 domain-containing protein [Phormidesmis sp.]
MSTPLDTPWKQILDCYFPQFMTFFFPDANCAIDWRRGFDFLDNELQQVTRESETGKRIVDRLVKVYLHSGEENWLLLHIEIQNQKEKDFNERIYIYSTRLFDKFRRPVASFAVLGDTDRYWRPQSFQLAALGSRHDFSFQIAKLVDYRQPGAQWSELLETSNNPFAIVVRAHLAAQATKGKASQQRRQQRKYNLTVVLYERGYSKQEVIDLYRFIDWVMTLPPALEEVFRADLETYEREKNMPYISTIERMGEARGEARGKLEGKLELLHVLLTAQVGGISVETTEQMKQLSIEQMDQLALESRGFTSIDELTEWLKQKNSPSL